MGSLEWVRTSIQDVVELFTAGDLTWQQRIPELEQQFAAIEDPVYRADAFLRLELVLSHTARWSGDGHAALRWLDQAETRLAHLPDEPRTHDQRWVINFNRAQIHQGLGDFDQADSLADSLREQAHRTLEPEARLRAALVLQAANALAAKRYLKALELYEQAVSRYRVEEPGSLAPVMLGLAQAQYYAGRLAEATRSAQRVAPLVGNNLELQKNLAHLQQLIKQDHNKLGPVDDKPLDELDERVSQGQQRVDQGLHTMALYQRGDLAAAHRAAQQELAEATPQLRAGALSRLAAITQDIALANQDPAAHQNAVELAQEAIAETHDDLVHHWRAHTALADFYRQWYEPSNPVTWPVLQEAMNRAIRAARELATIVNSATTAPARRDMARKYLDHAEAVAFDLAFAMGQRDILGELIEEKANRIPILVELLQQ